MDACTIIAVAKWAEASHYSAFVRGSEGLDVVATERCSYVYGFSVTRKATQTGEKQFLFNICDSLVLYSWFGYI
jgi:hypothetical protein